MPFTKNGVDTMNNWENDLKKGRYAELKFMGYLDKCDISYTDVGKVRMYQKMDIDLVVHQDTSDIDIEIKSDETIHKYGNLAIETISSRNIWSDGWIHYTKAKWLLFYVPQEDIFYQFLVKDIKKYMKENSCREVNAGTGKCKLIPIKSLIQYINDGKSHKLDVSMVEVDKEKLKLVA